jgi:hypothetical protein
MENAGDAEASHVSVGDTGNRYETQVDQQNELDLDSEYVVNQLDKQEFYGEFSDRARNKEKYEGEFDKRVADLAQKISNSDIRNTLEFASKPVVGAEEFTRADYVANAIKFAEWNPETGVGVPPELEEELRKFLPALCVVESRFDADRERSVKAKGIFPIRKRSLQLPCAMPCGTQSIPLITRQRFNL